MSTREDWMRRLGPLYGGAVALVHSTPWRWPLAIGNEARSPFWIVVLGAPIGFVAWLAAALCKAAGMPPSIGALLGLAVLSLASAALVERGLVDRLDQRLAGRASEPSGPSVTATLVLVFATLIRAAAILSLPSSLWLGVLVTTALVGRWAAVFLQALGDPIQDDDAPRSLVATPAPAWLTAALTIGVAVVAIVALGKRGFVALALTAAIAFALGIDAQRRDRGLSSPVVATAAAVGELVVLLVATIS
jgi:adenosylcobinamide-GDP ribazoletransferase